MCVLKEECYLWGIPKPWFTVGKESSLFQEGNFTIRKIKCSFFTTHTLFQCLGRTQAILIWKTDVSSGYHFNEITLVMNAPNDSALGLGIPL